MQQQVYVFDASLKDNILLGREVSDKKYSEVVKKVKIVDGNPKNLSGGEKQRVSLARVLVSPKDCIILDESFSSIDLESAQLIIEELTKLNKTLIIVTHREAELEQIGYNKVNI